MNTIIAIAVGGAAGALGRYGTQALALRLFGASFPYGTLIVNVAGSFLMGLLAHWFLVRGVSAEVRSLVLVGCLGALTTFSTFSLDAAALYQRGELGAAAVYVILSVVLSIGALFAGLALSRSIVG